MTQEDAFVKSPFALNEITGQLVERRLTRLTPSECQRKTFTLLEGDSGSPAVLCALLFDEKEVEANWTPLSLKEVERRIVAACGRELRHDLCGCMTCTRIA